MKGGETCDPGHVYCGGGEVVKGENGDKKGDGIKVTSLPYL